MFGGGIFLVDFGEVAATTETLIVLAVVVRVILAEHDTVLLRLTLPVPHTIVDQSVADRSSCIIILGREVQGFLP